MNKSDALQQSLATQQAKPSSPAMAFSNLLERMKPQIALALPKHLNADRMARIALTEFNKSKQLQECTPQTILASLMTAAQLGLEPGIGGQGYLIPYGKNCTFVPGWKGLVDLVSRSGRAVVWTGVVRPGDAFEYRLGSDPKCDHIPGDGIGDEEFTHVYACGKVRGAELPIIEVWTRAKVLNHLNKYNKVGERHYAKKDENNLEMYAKKVVLLQILKYMPQSIELNNALEISDAADSGKTTVINGDFVTVSDSDGGAGSWQPTAEERAEINAREMRDAA